MVTSSCVFFQLPLSYSKHTTLTIRAAQPFPIDPTTGTVIFSFLPASFVLSPHITALPVNEHRSNQKRFAMGHLYAEAEKGLLCKAAELFPQG